MYIMSPDKGLDTVYKGVDWVYGIRLDSVKYEYVFSIGLRWLCGDNKGRVVFIIGLDRVRVCLDHAFFYI